MKLNLGAGDRYADGWWNVDRPDCPHRKDEAFDLRNPLPWVEVEYAYAGHVLEHLRVGEALILLERLLTCMAPGGLLMVVGPDVVVAEGMALTGSLDVTLGELKYGASRWPGDEHRWECAELDLRSMLRLTGWVGITNVGINQVPSLWPVADRRPQWQCAISAKRSVASGPCYYCDPEKFGWCESCHRQDGAVKVPWSTWRRYWVRHPLPDEALQHRSQVFSTLLSKWGYGQGIADAVSNAGLGFLGGAPRNPDLSGKGAAYSTVRYAEQQYNYATVVVTQSYCSRCGRYTSEKHSLELVDVENQERLKVGHLKKCKYCDRSHWLFVSHMPSSVSMRTMRARSVP